MTLTTHVVGTVPDRLADLSPVVYARRSRSLYIGPSLGRGQHYQVYNLMQRLRALSPATAHYAHGYYRPDGGFEWYEYFPVPDRLEERDIRLAIQSLVAPEGLRIGSASGRRWPRLVEGVRHGTLVLRRRLRPLRAQTRIAVAQAHAIRSVIRPPRPPRETPDRVADLSQVEPYPAFITPNGYASRCRYVLNHDVLSVNEEIGNDWWFCNGEWLEYFFRTLAPTSSFVLISSNSDRAIGRSFARRLRRPNLVAWFAINVAFEHPKLYAIPLGLGDPSEVWGHAGGDVLAAQRKHIPKTHLFEASFDVTTNPEERLSCLAKTGLSLDPTLSKGPYLDRLAASFFCIAPSGNGIDTHRVWEALYLRTIPVVTRSVLTDQHPEFPLIVLDDWSEFASIDFSPELYTRTWGDWRLEEISLERYVARISETAELLRASRRSVEKPSEP